MAATSSVLYGGSPNPGTFDPLGSKPQPPEAPGRSDWGGYGMHGAPDLFTRQQTSMNAHGSSGFNPFLFNAYRGNMQNAMTRLGYFGPFQGQQTQMPFRFFNTAPWLSPRIGMPGMQGIRSTPTAAMPSQPQQPTQSPTMGMFGMASNPYLGGMFGG